MAQMETFQRMDLALEQAIMNQRVKTDQQAFYCIELGENKRSILVEPVNGNPYIYELGGHFTVFRSTPRSGTDKLRARTQAGEYFNKLNDCSPRVDTHGDCVGMSP